MKNNKSIQNLKKLKLSPGQALLIVIEKYKKRISKNSRNLNEEEITKIKDYIKRLCLLYLSGVESEEDRQVFKKAMEDKVLSGYYLSYDYDTIDEDPTRRYFETHLSALTLKYSLDKLNLKDLGDYYKLIYAVLPAAEKIDINQALKYSTADLTGSFTEYISILKNLNPSLLNEQISAIDQDKMRLLIEYALLGVRAVNNSPIRFPLDIYGLGLFYKENRGLKHKAWQYNVNSSNLGIMKSYMPLPKDDLAYINKPTAYLRSADNTTFDKTAKWPRVNFNRLTPHPFSSSLSGTVLCQLRVINYFLEEATFKFATAESLAQFMRCFISSLLYQAGGHSLHEFTKVLALPEIRKAFDKLPGFEKINEETLFFKENNKAFLKPWIIRLLIITRC